MTKGPGDVDNSNRLHYDSVVFDAHCDFLFNMARDGRRFDQRLDKGHMDLPRLTEAGVTAQIFAIFTLNTDALVASQPTFEALRQVDAFYQMQTLAKEGFVAATTAAQIEQAKVEGKVAGVLGLEGLEPVAGDLGLLRVFHQLGVRNVGFTWNYRNRAADGVAEDDSGEGLTDFGQSVVREAARMGMLLDIAHLAPRGIERVLQLAEVPVIDSHANAYALCPHRRNLTDAQLDALAAVGGVICVTFVPNFIAESPGEASLEGLLNHIDHIVQRIGIDHVGLGSDFDGFDEKKAATQGLEDVSRLPALTAGLVARGYDNGAIRQILGLNLLRVFEQAAG